MIETKFGMPAKLVREVTSTIRRCVQDQSEGSLKRAPSVRWAIDHCPDPDRRRELAALIERIDELAPVQQCSFIQAIDEVQISSKLWLIEELTSRCSLDSSALWVLGGWYGVLPLLFNWTLERPPARIVCVDFDPEACAIGQHVIGSLYPSIEYRIADVMDLDYRTALAREPLPVLINTICEHLPEIQRWWELIPVGQLTVLQSNNYAACPDHVNYVQDLDEMKAQTPLSKLLYESVLRLPILDRFMLIGYR